MSEFQQTPFPEIKLFHPMEVVRKMGRLAFSHLLYEGRSEHFQDEPVTERMATIERNFDSEGREV